MLLLSSIVEITPNGQFFYCATIASGERYLLHLRFCTLTHQGRSVNTPHVSGIFACIMAEKLPNWKHNFYNYCFLKCAVYTLTLFSDKCARAFWSPYCHRPLDRRYRGIVSPLHKVICRRLDTGRRNCHFTGLSVVKHRGSSDFCTTLYNAVPCTWADGFRWADSPKRRGTRKV